MTAKEILKRLKAAGWVLMPGRKTGHKQLKHPDRPGKVTVPEHKGDVPLMVLKSIERQAGVKLT